METLPMSNPCVNAAQQVARALDAAFDCDCPAEWSPPCECPDCVGRRECDRPHQQQLIPCKHQRAICPPGMILAEWQRLLQGAYLELPEPARPAPGMTATDAEAVYAGRLAMGVGLYHGRDQWRRLSVSEGDEKLSQLITGRTADNGVRIEIGRVLTESEEKAYIRQLQARDELRRRRARARHDGLAEHVEAIESLWTEAFRRRYELRRAAEPEELTHLIVEGVLRRERMAKRKGVGNDDGNTGGTDTDNRA